MTSKRCVLGGLALLTLIAGPGCGKRSSETGAAKTGAAEAGAKTAANQARTPAGIKPAITIGLSRDAAGKLAVSAEPAPATELPAGLARFDCAAAEPLPCGAAKLCAELGQAWATQLGQDEAAAELGARDYAEDCSPETDGDQATPLGDFVAHAGRLGHGAEALADARVEALLVETGAGFDVLAQLSEAEPAGQREQLRASWELELDGQPGKELALIVEGASGASRLVLCRAAPAPECRALELGDATKLSLRIGPSVVVDGGDAALPFASLDPAVDAGGEDSVGEGDGEGPSGAEGSAAGKQARCKVTSSGETYEGECGFALEPGGQGSFSLTPAEGRSFAGASSISVRIVEKGEAEVRGLTADGVNSRWGPAQRSKTERACWDGADFRICVYAK